MAPNGQPLASHCGGRRRPALDAARPPRGWAPFVEPRPGPAADPRADREQWAQGPLAGAGNDPAADDPNLITDDGEQLDTPEHAGTSSGGAAAGQPAGTIPQLADFLLNGYWGGSGHHWGSSTITYNLGNLNAAEQALAVAALSAWHDVANVTFVQTTGAANITFNHNGTGTAPPAPPGIAMG